MTIIEGDSVPELFAAAAAALVADGRPVSPRGMPTRELFAAHLRLARPRARLLHLPPARMLNPAFAAAEAVWILSGSDEPWIYDYNARLRQYADGGVLRGAYGPRLRRWGGSIDQLERVVQILGADPDSRRAVIQLYDPLHDPPTHRDVPCTLGFRFHLRDGRLHMSTTMRSQDVWLGLPYDLFTFTVLHEMLAGWLGAELGEYHHHVDSLHLYEHDVPAARQAAELPAPPAVELPELAVPPGDFDALLAEVRCGLATGHPGWDALAEAIRAYRLWKTGDEPEALELAGAVAGPLGESLRGWLRLLQQRRALTTTGAR